MWIAGSRRQVAGMTREETPMEFTQEHEGIRRSVKKFIDSGDQPARRRMGGGRHLPRPRPLQEDGRPGLSRHQQAGQVRRHGARLLLPARVPRDAGPHPLRRRADGDRRADRHGDARALPLRLGGAVQGVPRALDQGRLRRLPRRVGGRRRLRRRLHQDHGEKGRRRLRHQRRQDVDHQRHPGRLDVPARQHLATGPRTRTSR